MRLFLTVALSLLLADGSFAHDTSDKAECTAVKEKIRRIHSTMRSGYTRAQGEKMESRLRKLRKQRKEKCR